jgi:hypothetical protein
VKRTVAALILSAAVAHANVGSFAGSGQDIVLASTADVQMVSEDVTMVVRPEAAEYLCVFELRNLTDQPVELQAGFPLSGDWFDDRRHGVAPDDASASGATPDVQIVADRFRFIARDDDATYHVRYVRHDSQQKFGHLFLWTMQFAPHETRTLHVSYDIPASERLWSTRRKDWEILTGQTHGKPGVGTVMSLDAPNPELAWLQVGFLHWYSYVTATGASWAGDIERADFHVRFGLADEALREAAQRQMRGEADSPQQGMPPRVDPGPLLVWLCLAPSGAQVPMDERAKSMAEKLGVDWPPLPLPDAYDWHFAPFTPGPEIAIGWLTTFLPATAAGVRTMWRQPESTGQPSIADLHDLVRAALAAWHGVAPEDDATRNLLEQLIWYAPVAGRTEADLPDEVKAQLAVIDELSLAEKK